MARHLRPWKQPQKLPVVLTTDEVLLLLEAAPGAKYKAALGVAYGAGLRVSEVANLKVSDIDSERMVLRVEQGKGKKDRNGMLSRAVGVAAGGSGAHLRFSGGSADHIEAVQRRLGGNAPKALRHGSIPPMSMRLMRKAGTKVRDHLDAEALPVLV